MMTFDRVPSRRCAVPLLTSVSYLSLFSDLQKGASSSYSSRSAQEINSDMGLQSNAGL